MAGRVWDFRWRLIREKGLLVDLIRECCGVMERNSLVFVTAGKYFMTIGEGAGDAGREVRERIEVRAWRKIPS